MNSRKEYKYPKYWDKEDIIRFKIYMKTSQELFDMPDDLIELCVERQINEEKGLLQPIDHSKIVDIEVDIKPIEIFDTILEK